MRQLIAALILCVAVTASAVRPKFVIVADFQRPDQRFDLPIPVGDTRDIEVWCAQNNNEWQPGTGWTAYLKYMPSFDATGAYTMAGTISSNIITFTPARNFWGFPVKDWTIQVELINASDTSLVETAEGSLTITKSSASITNAFMLVPIVNIWSNETYQSVSTMLTSKVDRTAWMVSNMVYDAWIASFESWKETAGDFLADGTVPMTGILDMGNQDITNAKIVNATTLKAGGTNVLTSFTELDTIGKAWGSSGITAAATAQTTGSLAYALAASAQANQAAASNSLQAQVTAAIGATGITFSAGSGLVLSNVYNPVTRQFNVYLTTNLANPGGTNWVFWFKSTNCPAYGVRFQTDGE